LKFKCIKTQFGQGGVGLFFLLFNFQFLSEFLGYNDGGRGDEFENGREFRRERERELDRGHYYANIPCHKKFHFYAMKIFLFHFQVEDVDIDTKIQRN